MVNIELCLPSRVNNRELVIALVVHDLDGLLYSDFWLDGEGSTQLHGGDLLVVPPKFLVILRLHEASV